MYTSIRPGKVLYDTDGKRVQAHGGSMMYVDGTYYFYGENKEGITGRATGEKCPFWHKGVRLYSSPDMYNWKDEGVILFEEKDEKSGFYPKNIMDRPHILYNEKTKKYVLWAKCSTTDFGVCSFPVCVADNIKGPYVQVGEAHIAPFHAGDFDLIKDGGKAYVVYENPHTETVCQTLNEDYTDVTGETSSHLAAKCPPFVREAPAFFSHNGRKFLFTSGTTGYFPNPTRTAEIKDFHGEWTDLGLTCRGDKNGNSFHAQFSSVFAHPLIDGLFIALGDRWIKDMPPDMPDIQEVFRLIFDPDEKNKPTVDLSRYTDENTSEADYVWLPVRFDEDGTPYLEWFDEWKAEDFKI